MLPAINRKLIVMLAAITVAALSSWLLQVVGIDDETGTPAVRHDPDYYLKDFKSTFFDNAGKPSQRFNAPSMVHYPDTDTVDIVKPEMLFVIDPKSTWRISANEGWLSANAAIIKLRGSVDLQRQIKGRAPLHVLTPELYAFPALHYAESDSDVVIRDLAGRVTGQGLKVFIEEGKISLLSEVKGRYAPP